VKPFVGAIVLHKGKHAAIIVNVRDDEWVDLFVMPPNGQTFTYQFCEHGIGWEWPTITTATPIAALPDDTHPNAGFNGLPWGFHP
jgi:hypothetical protein